MNIQNYETNEEDRSTEGVKYIFTSEGNFNVVKAIQYTYLMDLNGRRVYNLGFGDYEYDTINDSVNTDNGDIYSVFNTVLSTIPKFFELFKKSILLVSGSDSSLEFVEKCKLTCKKKCISYCKNQHRRIRTYRYFVDKNFNTLKKEYTFLGGMLNIDNQTILEKYTPRKKYDSVWVVKK